MPEIVWPIAYIAFLLAAICFVAMAIYYAFRMYTEIAPHKRYLANLVPFLVGVLPGLLTPAGQRSRNKFVGFFAAAGICAALALVILLTQGPQR